MQLSGYDGVTALGTRRRHRLVERVIRAIARAEATVQTKAVRREERHVHQIVLLFKTLYERNVSYENDRIGNGQTDEKLVDVDEFGALLVEAIRAVGRVHEGQVE